MDGCGSGDVGQESALRRDGFPLTGGELTGRGRYLWGVRDAVRVRRCSLAVFVLPWRDFSPSRLVTTTVAPAMINRSPRGGRELGTWLHRPPCGERGNQSLQHRP